MVIQERKWIKTSKLLYQDKIGWLAGGAILQNFDYTLLNCHQIGEEKSVNRLI
jgi:hypothetical protein